MKNKKGQVWLVVLVVIILIGAVVGVIFLNKNNKQDVPNPVPEQPTNEVVNNEPIEETPVIPIVEEVCISNWSCSDWSSSCKNYKRTRTCVDLNECLNKTKEPSLTKSCGSGGGSYTPTPPTPPVPEPVVITDVYGFLNLTKKNLTDWIPYGERVGINYTKESKTFQVLNVPENYTLVYYPNIGDYSNWTGFVIVQENITFNLPLSEDLNGNETLSDYCSNGFNPEANLTGNCLGAKLWLVPNTDLVDGLLTWTNPNEYYFETELINYKKTD